MRLFYHLLTTLVFEDVTSRKVPASVGTGLYWQVFGVGQSEA